jgi:hypothetical protein
MAELNSQIPLQGLATTNPAPNLTAQSLAQTMQTQANTGEEMANTGLIGQHITAAAIQNELSRMNLINIQSQAQAYHELMMGNIESPINPNNPENANPNANPVTQGTAQQAQARGNVSPLQVSLPNGGGSYTTPGSAGGMPAGQPIEPNQLMPTGGAQPAPSQKASGTTSTSGGGKTSIIPPVQTGTTPQGQSQPATLTGTKPVLNPGVDPNWRVDPTNNWYVDKNGNPVSHLNGPQFAPNGDPNMYNEANIDRWFDRAIQLSAQNGGNPAALIQAKQTMLANAQKYDQTSANIQVQQAQARAATQKVMAERQSLLRDDAYQIVENPNPATQQALLNSMVATHGPMWSNVFNAMGIKPDANGVYDVTNPQVQNYLQSLSRQSGLATTQSSLETQAVQRQTSIIKADVEQGRVSQAAATQLTQDTKSGYQAVGVIRQAQAAGDADKLVTTLAQHYADPAGDIIISSLPSSIKGLLGRYFGQQYVLGRQQVNLQDLLSAANAKYANLDSTVQSNEGVKGAMGSNMRAQMAEDQAGVITMADIKSGTWQAKMALRQQYRRQAEDVAGTVLKNVNNTIGLSINGINQAHKNDPKFRQLSPYSYYITPPQNIPLQFTPNNQGGGTNTPAPAPKTLPFGLSQAQARAEFIKAGGNLSIFPKFWKAYSKAK